MDTGASDFVPAGTIAQLQAKGRLARRLIVAANDMAKRVV
jgi:hypothetical protein